MGTARAVVASSPSAACSFLKAHDAQFANRPSVVSAKDITYDGQNMVFANYGPRWKHLRKLSALHLLGGRALSNWAPIRSEEVGCMLAAIRDKGRIVLSDELVCMMANVIGRATMSRRVFETQGKEADDFKEMIVELLTGGGLFNIGDFVPAIAWMDLQGVQAKMMRVHQRFDGMITRMVADHRQMAAEREREGRSDFLDLLMANRHGDDGESLSDVNIKGLIFDLFTAGTDTSSIIIEWAMAEMLRNPGILRRAQEEVDREVGRERRLVESDIRRLPYLRAVCKEAMRLHPSTPLSLPHFSFEACEVEGYRIPGNTRLLVNIYAIGRDPDVWADPLRFEPERFLPGGRGEGVEPMGSDFELIPFGAGRRICAGKQAGMLMVQYVLGSLIHSFDWRLPDGVLEIDMTEKPGLALPMAVPLSAVAEQRLAPAAYHAL
ncbi:hypothetical protein HPP92_000648 [Vanilla planifolia]|uniref:Flavonoid 3',5'-hydroxylase n=1 Tax=Vanilla planifolia TaxID=51239 RepID=A0A835S1T2_VANPL|nr:hypothetical protein HPP92_000648 [Vanilla planifolia]